MGTQEQLQKLKILPKLCQNAQFQVFEGLDSGAKSSNIQI